MLYWHNYIPQLPDVISRHFSWSGFAAAVHLKEYAHGPYFITFCCGLVPVDFILVPQQNIATLNQRMGYALSGNQSHPGTHFLQTFT